MGHAELVSGHAPATFMESVEMPVEVGIGHNSRENNERCHSILFRDGNALIGWFQYL